MAAARAAGDRAIDLQQEIQPVGHFNIHVPVRNFILP